MAFPKWWTAALVAGSAVVLVAPVAAQGGDEEPTTTALPTLPPTTVLSPTTTAPPPTAPPPTTAPPSTTEANAVVTDEAEFRAALTSFLSIDGGHRIDIQADFEITGPTDPQFFSPAPPADLNPLLIDGHGHTVTVRGGSRFLDAGGDLTIEELTVVGGRSTAEGGAVHVAFGSLTVFESWFEDNEAAAGGALASTDSSPVTIDGSTFVDNRATGEDGGAVLATGALLVDGSTFAGNHAVGDGGAIASPRERATDPGPFALINSTFSENGADRSGGALALEAGRCCLPQPRDIQLTYLTLAGNTAPEGQQIAGDADHYRFTGTVFAGSGGGNCSFPGAFSTPVAFGNHSTDASCRLGDGQDDQGDPGLGPLEDNGGLTPTRMPGAALIDRIAPADCVADHDQRGVERPIGSGCDIGAVEGGGVVAAVPAFTG